MDYISKIESNDLNEIISSNTLISKNIISQINDESQMVNSFFLENINSINHNSHNFPNDIVSISSSNIVNDSFIYISNDNNNNDNNNNIDDIVNINNDNNFGNKKEKEIIILINSGSDIEISNTNNYLNKKKKRPRHDKFAKDNIKRKINRYYSKFVCSLLNEIIKQLLNENIQFFELPYSFIKDVTQSAFNSMKNKTLGDVFKYNVSPKYKNCNNYTDLNTIVYDKVTSRSEILKKILDKPYFEFFKEFLYHKKIINLYKYGLNKDILLLNNNNFFDDLKKKNKTNDLIADQKYFNKIESIINKNFLFYPVFNITKLCD